MDLLSFDSSFDKPLFPSQIFNEKKYTSSTSLWSGTHYKWMDSWMVPKVSHFYSYLYKELYYV